MFLNPIIHLILAGVSLVIGAAVVEEGNVLLPFVPFLFFVAMFCLTLLRPVNKGQKNFPDRSDRYRPAPKPTPQFHRLTTDDLHSMRPFGRQH